jgi:hypothetical protein
LVAEVFLPPPTILTLATGPAQPSDTHTLAHAPNWGQRGRITLRGRSYRADGIYDTDNFVARHYGQLGFGQFTIHDV